jgi:hypothetical protein
MFLSAGCSLLRVEGFSVLLKYERTSWRPRDKQIEILEKKKIKIFFFSCKILLTSAIKTLDPDNIIIP